MQIQNQPFRFKKKNRFIMNLKDVISKIEEYYEIFHLKKILKVLFKNLILS